MKLIGPVIGFIWALRGPLHIIEFLDFAFFLNNAFSVRSTWHALLFCVLHIFKMCVMFEESQRQME